MTMRLRLRAPARFILRKVGAREGERATKPCHGSRPKATAISVTPSTPMMMAPGIFRNARPAMKAGSGEECLRLRQIAEGDESDGVVSHNARILQVDQS